MCLFLLGYDYIYKYTDNFNNIYIRCVQYITQ